MKVKRLSATTVSIDLATLRTLIEAATAGVADACERCEDNQNSDAERELAANQNDEWLALVEELQQVLA
jgi:hypothetical protein